MKSMPNRYMSSVPANHSRKAFTFVEILFAVMILGIGFIMVAAMFPVAIKQTQQAQQESIAGDIGKEAGNALSQLAKYSINPNPYTSSPWPNATLFPVTYGNAMGATSLGVVQAVKGDTVNGSMSFWSMLGGNIICPSDTRFAFVPFYMRLGIRNATSTTPYPFAQLIVVACQCRNAPNFSANDLASVTTTSLAAAPNLQGRFLQAQFTYNSGATGANGADTVTFTSGATSVIAPNTYVIIADDVNANANLRTVNPNNYINGFVYRVGSLLPNSSTVWTLQPGADLHSSPFSPVTVINTTAGASYGLPKPNTAGQTSPTMGVWVVGRGYNNVNSGSLDTTYTGPAMDVAIFSTFVQCSQY